jgi:hypothetical protein
VAGIGAADEAHIKSIGTSLAATGSTAVEIADDGEKLSSLNFREKD